MHMNAAGVKWMRTDQDHLRPEFCEYTLLGVRAVGHEHPLAIMIAWITTNTGQDIPDVQNLAIRVDPRIHEHLKELNEDLDELTNPRQQMV